MHGDLPAVFGQCERNFTPQAFGGTSDENRAGRREGGHSGTIQTVMKTPYSLTSALGSHIAQVIAAQGGWIGFDEFMTLALYTPGLGYYANDSPKFGSMPEVCSDDAAATE